jgi:hypothetical protein
MMPRVPARQFTSRRAAINRRTLLQGSLGIAGVALAGCSAPGLIKQEDPFNLIANPAKDEWPPMFHEAPDYIRETYRFAVGNKDALQWMPCFCGCGEMGHASNYDCYVAEERSGGEIVLDPMSFG